MSVLTAPRSVAFTRQLSLPFAPLAQAAAKAMRATGAPRALREPAKTTAPAGDKPGGP